MPTGARPEASWRPRAAWPALLVAGGVALLAWLVATLWPAGRGAWPTLALGLALSLPIAGLSFWLWLWRGRALREQARAAGALRASETRARAVVESVADGILTLDHEGRVVGYSPGAERIFGHRPGEVLGQPAEVLLPILHAPEPGRHDTLAWMASGFSLPVEIAVTAMHDGLRRGFVVVVRDTTERRRSEQALRQSEERHRSVVAALSEGILVYDALGRLETCNPSAERILGRGEAELRAQPLPQARWRAVSADGSELPDDQFPGWRSLQSGALYEDVVFGLRDDQLGLRWVQATAVPLLRPDEQRPRAVVVSLRDVTERRSGELALATLNAQMRSLLDAATELAIVSTDTQGLIRVFNRGAERLLGYGADELLGSATPERFLLSCALTPPALEQRPEPGPRGGRGFEALVAKARRGTPDTHERVYVRKDGGRLDVNVTVSAQRDGAGRLIGFLFVASDISERRRAELRRSAQQAATEVLAQSPSLDDGLPRLLETLGRTLSWDCAHLFLVDRQAGVLRPAALWSARPSGFRDFADQTRAFVFPPGRGVPGTVWANGAALWLEDVQAGPDFYRQAAVRCGLCTGLGVPLALGGDVLGVMEFFSQERRAEEPALALTLTSIGTQVAQFLERDAADRARRAADERSRSVVDSMLEGLIVADDQARIELVNPAAERMFGYASWELVGQSLQLLMPPQAAAVSERYLSEAYRRALGQVTEWEACRKNGEVFPMELSLVEFHTADGRLLLAGHVRDLTEARRLERMKKEFVATVSHELRTPLTSIRGSLALLLSGALGEMPDEGKDMLEIAERNTLRLIALINDILDLERLETGRLELRFEALPLPRLFERALESVRGMADEHGIALVAEPLDCLLRADGDRLAQVLVNLVSNAVKFSIRGQSVRVHCRLADGQAEVRVEDRGRGIPKDRVAALFQRFQQVEASDAREKGGTGLGLAISKAIVEQHGGSIGVSSELGQGSTFWFRVPLHEQRSLHEDALLDAMQSAAGDAPDVLLVDADPALLGVMTRQLLQQGLGARAAQDALQALAAVRQRAPALVVFDPEVPGGRGLPAELRALGLAGLPLLAYTALDLDAAACHELGLGPQGRALTKARESGGRLADVVLELLQQAEARPGQAVERA